MTQETHRPIDVQLSRLKPMLAQAASAGLDVSRLLSELGLPADVAARPDDATLSFADYYRVQNRLTLELSDETCQLSERQLLPGSTDYVLQHVGKASNLKAAMEEIARSYNLLHGGLFNRVEDDGITVDYVIDDVNFPYAMQFGDDHIYFAAESVLIFLYCMLATIAPAQASGGVVGLELRRPSRPDRSEHLEFWRAPLSFGSDVYRVKFDRTRALKRTDAPRTAPRTSAAVFRTILATIETGSPFASGAGEPVAFVVRRALDSGATEQSDVAEAIGVSVATLRRRLQAEGESFRSLRRDVLNAKAKRLLEAGESVTETASRLGFAEFRSFNRAFKEWNGLTPKAYATSGAASQRPQD